MKKALRHKTLSLGLHKRCEPQAHLIWFGNSSLQSSFPGRFLVCSSPNGSVLDHWDGHIGA